MGVCASSAPAAPAASADPVDSAKNARIAQEQAVAEQARAQAIRLLILGSGDSGKTTLRKQMRSIYSNGFPPSVRSEYARTIIGNLVDGYVDIIKAMGEELSLEFASDEAKKAAEFILAQPSNPFELSAATAQQMTVLLADAAFKEAVTRSAEFQLQDCWHGFAAQVANYPAWGGPGWVPTAADCIASRVRTSGVLEEDFIVDGVAFKLMDVGGQRAERRKWINCFDDSAGVMYVASISEYNQSLYEDHSINRVIEALDLFEKTCAEKALAAVSFILFLNKRDIFDEKIKTIPLDRTLSALEGCPKGLVDAKTAAQWLQTAFLARAPKGKKVYVHVTCATDPNNIKRVFQDCKNILLQQSMSSAGFNVGA